MSDVRVIHEPAPIPRLKLSGAAVVCCVHGAVKRQVTELVADRSREQVKECACCQNLYPTDLGDLAVLCHECRPRSAAV